MTYTDEDRKIIEEYENLTGQFVQKHLQFFKKFYDSESDNVVQFDAHADLDMMFTAIRLGLSLDPKLLNYKISDTNLCQKKPDTNMCQKGDPMKKHEMPKKPEEKKKK